MLNTIKKPLDTLERPVYGVSPCSSIFVEVLSGKRQLHQGPFNRWGSLSVSLQKRALGYRRPDNGGEATSGNNFSRTVFYEGETPDRDYFIRQVQEYGYDLSEYLAALDRVPVFSKEKVDNFISYNKSFSRFIADFAERSLRNFEAEEELRLAHDELENRVVERTEQLEKIAKGLACLQQKTGDQPETVVYRHSHQ